MTIYVVDPSSPAWNKLKVGDVVTSIDGTPTTNPTALQSAVRVHHPGDTVTIHVGTIAKPTPGRDVTVRLGSTTSTTSNHKKVAFLGIGDKNVPVAGMERSPPMTSRSR